MDSRFRGNDWVDLVMIRDLKRFSRKTYDLCVVGGGINGAAIASFPIIDIVDSDDVILPEIAAGLNLDELDVDLAGVGEPMRRADRQIDRLVLVDESHLLIERDLGCAAHDHPMLGPMVVLL